MSWFKAALRIALFISLAAIIGWQYGEPAIAIILALVGLVAFWLHQLKRVQRWLLNPESSPPDVYGIWGELLAEIYVQQRRNARQQESLQSTVDYLRDSFASMREGVIMLDQQAAITWMNQAAQPLLGLRFPEDEGQTLTNLLRAPEFNKFFAGGDYREPLQYSTGGENARHLQVEVTRFGKAERLLFIRDVTSNVRMEKTRREFVGNVSHELRTPLTVITGYLGTLLADPAGFKPPYLKALQQMSQQAARMESLLKDLLWLSRIESEKREDRFEMVDVASLLGELREDLANAFAGRKVELDITTRRKVYGDYRELHSAISNLLQNAIKYSADDTVVTAVWQERGKDLMLAVRDQGLGIDSVHFPRLTERFYRVDDSRASATGGTGLGLAIVKHVAAAHGAKLNISSEPGKGSQFSLVFPSERLGEC
tara:strand:+ start:151643 stop:152923 length:1281 start_codon:yes stop_codon:yes gene_type:complete